jgi:hypothetical protein
MDFSESMKYGNRKKYGLWTMLEMVKHHIGYEDRIAYLRFNTNIYHEFELQPLINAEHATYLKNHIYASKKI